MQVLPDPVLSALMALPFLVTFLALNVILFQPLLAYLEERREATEGARAEADRLEAATRTRIDDLEQRLATAREELAARRAAARARAAEAESRILSAARAEADEQVEHALRDIAKGRDEASNTLRATASGLSTDIASQVLGRPVSA